MSKRLVPSLIAAVILALGVAAYRQVRNDAPAVLAAPATSGDAPTVSPIELAALRWSRAARLAPDATDWPADPDLPLAPQLAPDSGALVRAAVAPGVQRCVAEAAARGVTVGRMAVAYRLEARDGHIRAMDAAAEADDATLVACIAQAAAAIDVASPGQPDGVQELTAFF